MDGDDSLCKRKITVKTENKTKTNYNSKKKSQPKIMTFPATPLFHKSNTEKQMVKNTGFYSAKI